MSDLLRGRPCFLCRRTILPNKVQKRIDESTLPSSKKSVTAVLDHLARLSKTELHIPYDERLCIHCYEKLVDYDKYMMKMLCCQRSLTKLVEKAALSVDSELEEECDQFMANLEELNNEHFFDDANVSDSEIAQTMNEAMRHKGRSANSRGFTGGAPNEPLKCAFCAMRFKGKVRLQRHITQAHKKFSCEICNYSHRNEDYVILHMNIHEGRKENQCRFCEKDFTTKISTIRHMEVHFDSKKYQCDKCGLCFSQTTVLYNHKLQHEAEEQPLQCEICSQVFKTKRTYRHHMITHRADRPRYRCEYCAKTFTEKYTLKVHKRTHPESMEAALTPQMTQEQAIAAVAVSAAPAITYELQTSQPESKHNCIICEQVFNSKDHLNKHMEKEHDVILKSLTLSNFTQYEVVSNETKKPCHICGQMFCTQNNLDYHLEHVHGVAFK